MRPIRVGKIDGIIEENLKDNIRLSTGMNCITVDQNDTQLNMQRSYNQSLIGNTFVVNFIETKVKLTDIAKNKNFEEQIKILKNDTYV